MLHIAMLSGGQDSTAMTVRLLEIGEPVDHIVFADTGLEFDEMYEYLDKLDAFFMRKYGKKIERVHPRDGIEHWALGKVVSGEHKGKIRGMPMIAFPCYWRREVKEYAFNRWVKGKGEYKTYIGYTSSEKSRAGGADKYGYSAPLIDWGWNENKVRDYLRSVQMENSLYQDFLRTGCAICPKQGENNFYVLWQKYPKRWAYAKELERKINQAQIDNGEKPSPQFSTTKFTDEMEIQFERKSKGTVIDFDFDPPADCFCAI